MTACQAIEADTTVTLGEGQKLVQATAMKTTSDNGDDPVKAYYYYHTGEYNVNDYNSRMFTVNEFGTGRTVDDSDDEDNSYTGYDKRNDTYTKNEGHIKIDTKDQYDDDDFNFGVVLPFNSSELKSQSSLTLKAIRIKLPTENGNAVDSAVLKFMYQELNQEGTSDWSMINGENENGKPINLYGDKALPEAYKNKVQIDVAKGMTTVLLFNDTKTGDFQYLEVEAGSGNKESEFPEYTDQSGASNS